MKSHFKCRAARRPRNPDRRRSSSFSFLGLESLESRELLAAGSLGINVEIGPFQSFVNWLQVPGDWTANPGQSNSIALNSSSDPTSDATLLFDYRVNQPWNGPDPNAVAPSLVGTYHLSFTGQATISQEYPGFSTPFTVQNQTYDAATNTTAADLVVPATSTSDFFGITFSNTMATAGSAADTGFSNAKLIRPGYAATSTQLYTNEFLSALQPYSVLRYLDPENTNGQPFFNGNTLVTVNASQVDQTGMPWEYLVALANQTNTDMWINIPQGATNDYVSAVAGIIKNGGTVGGVTFAGLNPNLKIYVEYSNEVWGGIPTNEYYQEAAVQNQASNTPLSTFPGNQDIYQNPDGTTSTDVNLAVGRRYLERTAQLGQIFQSVLGADPTHQRIRPVLGWQENNTSFYPAALNWFQTYFGPASASFYGMGNADYWSPTDYSSVDAVISSLQAQETSYAIPNSIDYTTIARFYGLNNVSYEGGPSISADPSTAAGQVALAASRDPRMEALVKQHYLDYFQGGGTLANYFDGPFGTLSPSNEWPIAELSQYGNPSQSPRYQGTVDLASAAPVAVNAGIPVPASVPTTFSATSDTLGTSFASPSAGSQGFWLLNAVSSGTFDLALSTLAGAGSSAARFEMFLNNQEIGGVFTQGTSSSIDLGNVAIPSGLSTLSIVILNGGSQFQPTNFAITPIVTTKSGLNDPGFESVNVGTGYSSYSYATTGSPWTFSGSSGNGSGLSGNGSGFTFGNPNAPQGSQVAFLQGKGTITQSVTGWSAGSYMLSFDAAQRGNYGTTKEDFAVLVDGSVIGTFTPTGTSYQIYTTPAFTVTAGTHTIEFLGLDSVGGDNTVFLDAVSVATTPTQATISDSGFESVNVGSGPSSYSYATSGSPWTFSGSSGNGSGLSGNGSGFTFGNPNAPQGSQVAFLQGKGTITQSVAGWTAGSYTLSFDAAQRGNYGVAISVEDFEVLVDGVVVGTFKPSGISYQLYTSNVFTVAAGVHTIAFVGLDSAGGDNTVFLDAVKLSLV